MDFNRQIGGSASFLLLILGNVITVTGVNMTAAVNLECTNDYEKYMFCQFEAQNCLYYNLTLLSNDGYGKNSCIFQTCAAGCCCSVEMILVTGETHTATVWKAGRLIESQTININNSIKPKTPKILSVKETNGNFQVRWTTNMNSSIRHTLTAQVTYYKKGDTQKVTENSTSCPINGESSYEISGRRLEPSTTYVVSVKSYTLWSNRFSDSSKEEEFTTGLNLECTND
ncbi:hypothetical protein Q5P01_006887 [Channa striata]|uniref:Fibronectin type-III domain-containing protein n=1 Tax=Channa striata TaxID=64152 RepID=A0AA88N8T0_CHASR|nr:hypothetical protein Q5P01_006887 [Channa striata]